MALQNAVCATAIYSSTGKFVFCVPTQWRRQNLLRGGAKLEIMSWGTHGGLQRRVQQLLDDLQWLCHLGHSKNTFINWLIDWLIVLQLMQYWLKELRVVDICTSWSPRLHKTWILMAVRFTPKWTKNEIVRSRGGHVPQCPIAGDATVPTLGTKAGVWEVGRDDCAPTGL